jgi:hypothetical protein
MSKQEYGPGQEQTPGKTAAQQRAEYVEALREERRGYVQRGLDDRVREVDAAIRNLTAEAKPRQKSTRGGGD